VSQSLIAKTESRKIVPTYNKTKALFDSLERLERKKDVQVRKLIKKEIIAVQNNDSVKNAIQIMAEQGFSQLPVFKGDLSVGHISEKIILNQVSAGKDLDQISKLMVDDLMGEAFPQISPNAPLSVASNLLKVYSAILIYQKGRVIGILTKADLLRIFL
ncbi:unnamed protein product, partial [marine sediment metagenome]